MRIYWFVLVIEYFDFEAPAGHPVARIGFVGFGDRPKHQEVYGFDDLLEGWGFDAEVYGDSAAWVKREGP